ncbi:hypothetical protein WG66_011231 [Moniliophthora roreri]|nr:hypothetical protein WG66_011231 [Moniliophthora roreri]
MSALQITHLHALRLDTHRAPFRTTTAHAHEHILVDRRHRCGHRIPILINRTPSQLLLLSSRSSTPFLISSALCMLKPRIPAAKFSP